MDVVFAIDGTTSMDWPAVLNFAAGVTDGLNINSGYAKVGLSTFTSSVNNAILLNAYGDKQLLENAIRNVQKPTESAITGIKNAIETVQRAQFATGRSSAANVLVVITDGQSDVDYNTLTSAASTAWGQGTRIVAVGIGNIVNSREISGISSQPQTANSDYWLLPSYSYLPDLIPSMTNKVCASATTPPTSAPAAQGIQRNICVLHA